MRALFVNNATVDLPLPPGQASAWDALSGLMDVRVIARLGRVEHPDARFRLIASDSFSLAGRAYHARLPWVVLSEFRQMRPHVIATQSPYEGFACLGVWRLLRPQPKLLVQVHGDWRTASRLYGSRSRKLVAPIADRAASVALRRADGIRAVGPYTAFLARQAAGEEKLIRTFPAYFDLETFRRDPIKPLPSTPTVAWIGALERTKNIDGFVEAWRRVVTDLPGARVVVVGRGRMNGIVHALARELPDSVTAIAQLPPEGVARVLDESTLLAVPSRSEGTPRVVMEAFTRGRAVVASPVGGIPDLIVSGRNGLLVPPDRSEDIAEALIRVLRDPDYAATLGGGAYASSHEFELLPERFAEEVASLIQLLAREA